MSARRAELAAGLAAVRERIARACEHAERDPGEIDLVVVTKFFPASDVRLLADLGVTDVGENRHQEAEAKHAELTELTDLSEAGLRWHFLGGIQSNKAAAIAAYADVVQSLDRVKVLRKLAAGAVEAGREVEVLVQVDLDPGDGSQSGDRSGVAPGQAAELATEVAGTDGVRLGGVMGVAPLGQDPAPAFARLAEVAAAIRSDHAAATTLSAGMSGDLEAAIAAGATQLRVGSAILGERPSPQ
ncbi:YggS family pyridoxal phosphate-dependent enzyme [Nocardioidaceae bacterium]|nr:YggS family pyridoxal phosphate-dependent enzyme [Nocardioidaceae bacterium]